MGSKGLGRQRFAASLGNQPTDIVNDLGSHHTTPVCGIPPSNAQDVRGAVSESLHHGGVCLESAPIPLDDAKSMRRSKFGLL